MADQDENLILRKVLAELCEALGSIIVLAPIEQRPELSSFALSQIALIVDFIREQGSTQH
jgi:hypothetical protein